MSAPTILKFPGTAKEDDFHNLDDIAGLVDQAAELKEIIAGHTEDLRLINQALAEKAEFKAGSKTGHIAGRHYAAKVQLKEYVKWDQAALAEARRQMGDAEFFKIFKWTFEPQSAKALSGALEFGRHGALIEAARTISPGSPCIIFEKMESC